MLTRALILAVFAVIANGQCSWPFSDSYQFGNKCYYIYVSGGWDNGHIIQYSWAQAEELCREDDGNLASIQDVGTNNFVFALIPQGSYAWIGLRDQGTGPLWSDGLNSTIYKNFAPKQEAPPSCYIMSAVTMYYPGQWVAMPCNLTITSFVCERTAGNTPPPPPSTTPSPFTCAPYAYYNNNGTIESPGYPLDFPSASCTWQISVSNNNANIELPPIRSLNSWSLILYSGTLASNNATLFRASNTKPYNSTVRISSPNPQILITFIAAANGAVDPFILTYSGTAYPLYPIPNKASMLVNEKNNGNK